MFLTRRLFCLDRFGVTGCRFFLSTRPPIFVSSANFEILLIMFVSKSLIYTIKRMGPRTDPWGTPLVTSDQFEDSQFMTTRCCLSFNQFLIQAKRFPLTP